MIGPGSEIGIDVLSELGAQDIVALNQRHDQIEDEPDLTLVIAQQNDQFSVEPRNETVRACRIGMEKRCRDVTIPTGRVGHLLQRHCPDILIVHLLSKFGGRSVVHAALPAITQNLVRLLLNVPEKQPLQRQFSPSFRSERGPVTKASSFRGGPKGRIFLGAKMVLVVFLIASHVVDDALEGLFTQWALRFHLGPFE